MASIAALAALPGPRSCIQPPLQRVQPFVELLQAAPQLLPIRPLPRPLGAGLLDLLAPRLRLLPLRLRLPLLPQPVPPHSPPWSRELLPRFVGCGAARHRALLRRQHGAETDDHQAEDSHVVARWFRCRTRL